MRDVVPIFFFFFQKRFLVVCIVVQQIVQDFLSFQDVFAQLRREEEPERPEHGPADEHAPDEPAFSFPFVLVHVCRAHYYRRRNISPPPPPPRRRRQSLFSSSHERSHNQSARGRHCGV